MTTDHEASRPVHMVISVFCGLHITVCLEGRAVKFAHHRSHAISHSSYKCHEVRAPKPPNFTRVAKDDAHPGLLQNTAKALELYALWSCSAHNSQAELNLNHHCDFLHSLLMLVLLLWPWRGLQTLGDSRNAECLPWCLHLSFVASSARARLRRLSCCRALDRVLHTKTRRCGPRRVPVPPCLSRLRLPSRRAEGLLSTPTILGGVV